MSHVRTPTSETTVPRQYAPQEPVRTGWFGWIVFAATMLVITGVFQAIQGFVALFKDTYYVVGSSGLTVQVDYTTWGWTHLAFGAALLATGLGLFAGQTWARVAGVVFAGLSMVVNFAFLAAFPVWGIIMIALDAFVIWALTVHGEEMKHATR